MVWLLWSYTDRVLVDGFGSFNDATTERLNQGHSFFAFAGVGGENV